MTLCTITFTMETCRAMSSKCLMQLEWQKFMRQSFTDSPCSITHRLEREDWNFQVNEICGFKNNFNISTQNFQSLSKLITKIVFKYVLLLFLIIYLEVISSHFWGVRCISMLKHLFMVWWNVGSFPHSRNFTFQPVLHDWCNKGCGMYYPVSGMVHIKELMLLLKMSGPPSVTSRFSYLAIWQIKEPLLLIRKSSLCGGSGFPFSLSEWSLTICLTPYNRK